MVAANAGVIPNHSLPRMVLAGVVAGAIAAVVASLLSLRLPSPDPVFFNCTTVTIGALLAGVGAGVIWYFASRGSSARARFALYLAIALIVVSVVALLVEAMPGHPLTHVAAYVIPLALVVALLLALLIPLLSQALGGLLWVAPAAALVSLVIGIGLTLHAASGNGGRLALSKATNSSGNGAAGTGGALQPKDIAGVVFVVDPAQSKASYTVHEKLARLPLPDDAVGTTSAVAGTIRLDGQPSTVTVDVKTLTSDQPGRDRRIQEVPGLAHFAPAEFRVPKLSDLPVQYKPGETVTRSVQGTMKLNDIEKPMSFAVDARLQDNVLSIHGSTDFTWADFKMEPPNSALVQVDDKIHAEVLLVAKAQS